MRDVHCCRLRLTEVFRQLHGGLPLLGESSYASRVSNSFVLTRCSSVRSLLPSHTEDFHLSASFGAGFHLWKASKCRFTEFQQHSPIRTSRYLVPPDSVDQALGTGLSLVCGRARACDQQPEDAADEFGFWGGEGGGEEVRGTPSPSSTPKKEKERPSPGEGGEANPTPQLHETPLHGTFLRWTAQNFALFPHSLLFSIFFSLWWSSRGIEPPVQGRGPPNVHVWDPREAETRTLGRPWP